jgi:hypothetical protein
MSATRTTTRLVFGAPLRSAAVVRIFGADGRRIDTLNAATSLRVVPARGPDHGCTFNLLIKRP